MGGQIKLTNDSKVSTSTPVLLLIDNLGIIGELKKVYEYLYLQNVLNFYALGDKSRKAVKEQPGIIRRGCPWPANLFHEFVISKKSGKIWFEQKAFKTASKRRI